jgi:hypothetical protein
MVIHLQCNELGTPYLLSCGSGVERDLDRDNCQGGSGKFFKRRA